MDSSSSAPVTTTRPQMPAAAVADVAAAPAVAVASVAATVDPFELDVVIALVRERFPEMGTTDLGMAIMLERKKMHPGQTVADLVERVERYLRGVTEPPKA